MNDQDRVYADCAKSFAASTPTSLDGLRNSHILITGASGFMGAWLLSTIAFLNDVHSFRARVTAVARRPSRIAQRASFLAGRNDIGWVAADVRQLVSLPEDLDWLLHAAGVPDSRHHATSPIETTAVIAEGTFRILRLAEQAARLRQILHVSSGLAATAISPGHATGPTATYVDAKRFSETQCFAFRTQAKLPIVITRPFTLLGPFQDIESPWAANNFLRAAVENQALKIRGDGRALRSYLYGSDVATIALNQLTRGVSGDVYDLGGTETMSIIDLAQLVMHEAGRPFDIRASVAMKTAEDRFVPDMRKSSEQLGVTPAFSTSEAVRRSLAWYARLGF